MNKEQRTKNTKGFTLLELLVVLAIMGILTAIGVVSFTAAQVRARDSQRKSDLAVIASALESYFQKNKGYPSSENVGPSSCNSNLDWFCSYQPNPWIPNLTNEYITKLPKDPLNSLAAKPVCDPTKSAVNNAGAALTYGYYSAGAFGGKQYILSAKLENQNDPEISQTISFGGSTYSNHGCYAITSP